MRRERRPLISAATTIGIGMGGFVDGILFHQILQIHNMLSAKFPVRNVDMQTLVVHLEINMFWDGLFHIFTWLMTAIGIALLWRTVQTPGVELSTQTFVGSLLMGWGIFNVVEGILNHHLLHVHHVTETDMHLVWDLLFLGFGATLIGLGWWLIQRDKRHSSTIATTHTNTGTKVDDSTI